MASKEKIKRDLSKIQGLLDSIGEDIENTEFAMAASDLQRILTSIAQKAERLRGQIIPRPWKRLSPFERSLVQSHVVSRVLAKYLQSQEEEDVPIRLGIADNIYTMKVINGDEWTLFKNGEQIYATSDDVGAYALATLFLAMMQDWARIEEADGRENPGDLIDKVIFEVLAAHLVEMNTIILGESNDKLKEIIEDVTGREWNARQV